MRVRNRIKKMVAAENRYFNRKGAVSLLIGITSALLSFNLLFNIYYCFGMFQSIQNLAFFRRSAYALATYILLFIGYRIAMRYIGINYALIMGFSAVSFAAGTLSGYFLSRAAFGWGLNRLIENPLGFDLYLRRIYNSSVRYFLYILVFYLVMSLIPARRQRPVLLGRFWIFNILVPISIVPSLVLILFFAVEESRIEYAVTATTTYLTVMVWLAFRYAFKMGLYLLTTSNGRKVKIDDIPQKRRFFPFDLFKRKKNRQSASTPERDNSMQEHDNAAPVAGLNNNAQGRDDRS